MSSISVAFTINRKVHVPLLLHQPIGSTWAP